MFLKKVTVVLLLCKNEHLSPIILSQGPTILLFMIVIRLIVPNS